ncbi:hypothetical protein HGO38_19555 [Rhizobium sp. CG5]|uniref:hypothetical protein n=1 Tax=Rhizobium sp. CG5 TaxID=2726076 RepID=UPI0020346C62|nr:hypothetical protein [Rhizobium sp. CG5]MCM2475675.1 hypothetical protein [Rhizobium sp. CG5]
MLLLIGYLTTPTSTTGVSLSEFWAWVRYLAAIADDDDLRLTRGFATLDGHQKTILSDDFGMGLPMLWLGDRLSFDRQLDGYYFMHRIAASVGAVQRRSAKRGPNKTPDFVARDTRGVWHVVECKGTQSGLDYSLRQLGSNGPPPSGGVAQKRAIVFPARHTGQRLVCGLSIGVEGGAGTRLTIIDPEPKEPFVLRQDQLYLADDAATRGVLSKTLRLSGFEIAAEATASPLGRHPSATRYSTRSAEQAREELVSARDARAREELQNSLGRTQIFGGEFTGRELRFDLPRPISLNGDRITRAIVRQGVNKEVLLQLQERPTIPEPIFDSQFSWTAEMGLNTAKGDERTASFQIGQVFRSELILE